MEVRVWARRDVPSRHRAVQCCIFCVLSANRHVDANQHETIFEDRSIIISALLIDTKLCYKLNIVHWGDVSPQTSML